MKSSRPALKMLMQQSVGRVRLNLGWSRLAIRPTTLVLVLIILGVGLRLSQFLLNRSLFSTRC